MKSSILFRYISSLVVSLSIIGGLHAQEITDRPYQVAITAGSTGLGIEAGYAISSEWNVRVGYSAAPRVHMPTSFIAYLEGKKVKPEFDANGHRIDKFYRLADMLETMSGYRIDEHVQFNMDPTFQNFRFIVDWSPFKDKSWYVSAGMLVGPKEVGHAYNLACESSTMMAFSMYASMYDRVEAGESIMDFPGVSGMAVPDDIRERILSYGRLSLLIGTKKDGTLYEMKPDEKNMMMQAWAYSNRFRPYIGFGRRLNCPWDQSFYWGFDVGCAFWGGSPKIVTHEGVDLTHDMDHIVRPKLRHLVDMIHVLKVLPVAEVKIGFRLKGKDQKD